MQLTCAIAECNILNTQLEPKINFCLNGAWGPDLSSVVSHLVCGWEIKEAFLVN